MIRVLTLLATMCVAVAAQAQMPTSFYSQFERKPEEYPKGYQRPAYVYPKSKEPLGADGYRHCSPVRASFYNAMRIREAKQRQYVESREARIAADPSLADKKALFAKNMALASGRQ